MSDNKSKKMPGILARLRMVVGLNIGTIMFGILFIYMAFSAILYFTTTHIESYQVTSGPLSRNETYTGLAIREESLCKADSSGYITYYAREGSKINASGAVYGLSDTKTASAPASLAPEELSKVRTDMMSFSKGFSSSKFNSTYSFKYELKGNILQYAESGNTSSAPLTSDEDGEGNDSGDNDKTADIYPGNQTICQSQSDGIVLYSMDNYEGKTVDAVKAEDFDQNSYHETDLKTSDKVKAGDDIYTIITDELWSLLIPLSDRQVEKLKDRSTIRVKFLKDDMTQNGDFSIITIDGDKYGQIDFNKGLIRYASDRFLDIELVTNTVVGLKIPLTSIVTKDFYVIPSRMATTQDNQTGFTLYEGKNKTTFKNVSIYASIDDSSVSKLAVDEAEQPQIYYVDKSSFKEGDALINTDTGEKYVIGETDTLEGVYCINKGYAVFRRIEILDENEEYAIVSKNTTYGLSRYDHIVRNADKVNIEEACDTAGRSPQEVTLIAVSKTKPVEMLKEAYDAGARVFGENKVQEIVDKYDQMPSDVQWHMIGHLQRNKVKYIIDKVSMVHSVDSVRLAEAIEKEAAKKDICMPVLIEVNVAGEESKFGLSVEEVLPFLEEISSYEHLQVKGLMTIAPFVANPEENREVFQKLKKLSVDIAAKNINNVNMSVLSMGMTNDYQVAVEEGATMVRVGTGIFGERDYSIKED